MGRSGADPNSSLGLVLHHIQWHGIYISKYLVHDVLHITLYPIYAIPIYVSILDRAALCITYRYINVHIHYI